MKAITLWPEWAWAICHLGKNVENRSWVIPPGLYALHAGSRFSGKGHSLRHKQYAVDVLFHNARSESLTEQQTDRLYKLKPDDIPFSSIVGMIRVTGHTHPENMTVRIGWYDGNAIANHVELVSVLPTPIKCKGALGLWTVPTNIQHTMENQCPAR